MQSENVQVDIFVRRVLVCMKEQRRSVKDVQEEYMKLYPPGFLRKQFSDTIGAHKVETALRELVVLGFVSKEITRFHRDRSLHKDIVVYHVTNKGRSYLLPKKK